MYGVESKGEMSEKMNEKLAKWKDEKRRKEASAANMRGKIRSHQKQSVGSLSSTKVSTAGATKDSSRRITTTTKTVTKKEVSSLKTAIKRDKTSNTLTPERKEEIIEKSSHSPSSCPKPHRSRDEKTSTVNIMNEKVQQQLCYSKYLQLQFLRNALSKAAKNEMNNAEDDVLRGWQQVYEAENHLNRLEAKVESYNRKIDIYDNLQQLDKAIDLSRTSIFSTEKPLDAVITIENDLNNLFTVVTKQDQIDQSKIAAEFDILRTTLQNSKNIFASKYQRKTDETSSRYAQFVSYPQKTEEITSTMSKGVSSQLVKLDADLGKLWTELIAEKLKDKLSCNVDSTERGETSCSTLSRGCDDVELPLANSEEPASSCPRTPGDRPVNVGERSASKLSPSDLKTLLGKL